MSLQGKILEVHDKTVLVEVVPRPECSGCQACKGLLGDEQGPRTRQIEARKGQEELQPGDEVILDLNPGEGSIAAIMVFGLPMAGFFLGMFAAPAICDLGGFAISDTARLVCGFGGLATAFAGLALFSRSRFADKLAMRVMKKL